MNDKEIDTLFKNVDKSTDGTVSFKELETMFKKFDMTFTARDLRTIVKRYDKDGKTGMNRDEFRALITDVFNANSQYIEAYNAFQVFDIDKDGKITAVELRRACQNLNNKLTTKEINEMIQRFDKNGDGSLSLEEFAKAIALGL